MTGKKLTRLDRILLKGFYTNIRSELENPNLIDKDMTTVKQSVAFQDDPNEVVYGKSDGPAVRDSSAGKKFSKVD